MDTQIDHAAGMPIELLDELPSPVDATESIFPEMAEQLVKGHLYRDQTDYCPPLFLS